MTEKEHLNQQRLQTSIQKCKLHLKRLQYASDQIAGLFPLTVDSYNVVSEATIGNIDQMVFRFTKLQDEIGNKSFNSQLVVIKWT